MDEDDFECKEDKFDKNKTIINYNKKECIFFYFIISARITRLICLNVLQV